MQLFTTFTTLSYHSTTVTFHCDVFSCRASAAQEVEWIIHQSEGQWRPSSDTVNPGFAPDDRPVGVWVAECRNVTARVSTLHRSLCHQCIKICVCEWVNVLKSPLKMSVDWGRAHTTVWPRRSTRATWRQSIWMRITLSRIIRKSRNVRHDACTRFNRKSY